MCICLSVSDLFYLPKYPLCPSMLSQMVRFYSSYCWVNSIMHVCMCVFVSHLLYPFIYWWTPHLLTYFGYCKYCNEQSDASPFSWISVLNFFDKYPEVELLVNLVVLFFNFLRKLHTVFHSSCTNLHHDQQCISIPFFPHPHQHIIFPVFLIITILTGMWWYFSVVLICSILISDAGYFFMHLLAVCISMSTQILCSFSNHIVCFSAIELHELFIYFTY